MLLLLLLLSPGGCCCRFVWLGESAVASWGKTDGVDATAGTQPFGTSVTRNLCHEIGHYEKQTSCYFQAASGNATLSHNIYFNSEGWGGRGGDALAQHLLQQ